MNETDGILPRCVEPALAERMRIMPVTVVSGARQTGKSTLVTRRTPGHRRLITLDDFDALDLARRDPMALLDTPEPVTLDEVQREPRLLQAVKMAVDARPEPGRFIITGSANLLLMRQVSETLAGRAAYLTLWPMTRREQLGLGTCGRWQDLLDTEPRHWRDLVMANGAPPEDWKALAARGGFPVPAVRLSDAAARRIWFDGYVRTYLERDIRDLSSIASLPDYRRLLQAMSMRLGGLLNQTALSRDLGMSQPTVHRYLNLLEMSHMLVRVPSLRPSRSKRLVKACKTYWADTGLALHLAGAGEPTGAHLENLVLQDLLAWRDTRPLPADVLHWRTATGGEVDFVIETADRLLPIEVKATHRPTVSDARWLGEFRREYGEEALPGLLVHAGDATTWLTSDALAVPWWRVV